MFASFIAAGLLYAPSFYLHSGDHVVFYGDSISDQQLYTVNVETYVLTRFPTMKVEFTNLGWSYEEASGGHGGSAEVRVKRDFAPTHPSVVTIMLGMNDGKYVDYDPKTDAEFGKNYEKLVSMMKAAALNAKYTFILTSPWDDFTRDPSITKQGYDSVLLRYGHVVKDAADKWKGQYVDFNAPMADVMKRAKGIDLGLANQIVPDWIHPGPPGHLIMAGVLLQAWNAPSLVASVTVDSVTHTAQTVNCQVRNLKGAEWDELDGSLPYPIDHTDKALLLTMKLWDFTRKLNHEPLTVTGLAAGTYELDIDGQKVGEFDAKTLAGGIDMGDMETPMAAQAAKVKDLTAQLADFRHGEWREVEVPQGTRKEAGAVVRAMDRLAAAIVRDQRAAATPIWRHFSLKPVK